jgi:hypothetical protein
MNKYNILNQILLTFTIITKLGIYNRCDNISKIFTNKLH